MRKLSKYEKETIINWNEGETILHCLEVEETNVFEAVKQSVTTM